jgi:hypothetical protein
MDPRVATPAAELAQQYALGRALAATMALSHHSAEAGIVGRAIDGKRLRTINGELGALLVLTQPADVAPTPAQRQAFERLKAELQSLLVR